MKFNADRIIGISAMLISLITLFIFLYQTTIIHKQSRLSVRPRLSFSKNISLNSTISPSGSDTISIVNITLSVRNNGLGPAIVESAKYNALGQSFAMASFFREAYPRLSELGSFKHTTDITVGEAIPSNETVELFEYEYNLDRQLELNDYLDTEEAYELPFAIEITYSSLYEETWKVSSNSESHPELID